MLEESSFLINKSLISQFGRKLDGKTPAEVCGINIEGKNKWKTLIQNASQNAIK